jgi:hypothetical protein
VQRLRELAAEHEAGIRVLGHHGVVHRGVELVERVVHQGLEPRTLAVELPSGTEADGLVGWQPGEPLGVIQVLEPADLDVFHEIDDRADRLRIDAPQENARRVRRARRHRLAARDGRRGSHARDLPHVVEQVAVVREAPAVDGLDLDVRVVAQDLALQVGSEASHDRYDQAQRERAQPHAEDREHADDGQKAALARAYVPGGDEADEATALEEVEHARQGERAAAQHEPHARDHDSDAHHLVPRDEGARAPLGQRERPRAEPDHARQAETGDNPQERAKTPACQTNDAPHDEREHREPERHEQRNAQAEWQRVPGALQEVPGRLGLSLACQRRGEQQEFDGIHGVLGRLSLRVGAGGRQSRRGSTVAR